MIWRLLWWMIFLILRLYIQMWIVGFTPNPSWLVSNVLVQSSNLWLVDSGSSIHMTYKCNWLVSFKPIPISQWLVEGILNKTCWVKGIGDILLQAFVTNNWERIMFNILYVLELGCNLFYIIKTKLKIFNTIFNKEHCQMWCKDRFII